jgi:putative hydrolase of the HAD superfamily
MPIRAVLFDIGGVIAESPIMAIRRYCDTIGIPDINPFLGESNAWNAFMRNELKRPEYDRALEAELMSAGWGKVDVTALMDGSLGAQSGNRSLMIRTIRRLRDAGLLTGALTNNWASDPLPDAADEMMRQSEHAKFTALFDAFVESSVTGLQKPDPAIYCLALQELGGIPPSEVAFLDDIGINLKSAKKMGMVTIKVNNDSEWQWLEAVAELEAVTGVALLEPEDRALHSWPAKL